MIVGLNQSPYAEVNLPFLGNLPADALETLLEGCPYTEEALASALSGIDTRTFFDGVDNPALAAFLLGR